MRYVSVHPVGEEHIQRRPTEGGANASIREPKATKGMYDAVQAMHPTTLSAYFILATCTSKRDPEIRFRDMMETVMESGPPGSQLHPKWGERI